MTDCHEKHNESAALQEAQGIDELPLPKSQAPIFPDLETSQATAHA